MTEVNKIRQMLNVILRVARVADKTHQSCLIWTLDSGLLILTRGGQFVALMFHFTERAMFRFHIIFLTWSDMWWTRGHDTSTLSSPLQWHYLASRAPLKTPRASNYNQRPYNYVSAANDNSGTNSKKGAEKCTFDKNCPMISKFYCVTLEVHQPSAPALPSRVSRSLKYWTKGTK